MNGVKDIRGVAQMVARTVRDREVVGSNPAAPIFWKIETAERQFLFWKNGLEAT